MCGDQRGDEGRGQHLHARRATHTTNNTTRITQHNNNNMRYDKSLGRASIEQRGASASSNLKSKLSAANPNLASNPLFQRFFTGRPALVSHFNKQRGTPSSAVRTQAPKLYL